MNNSYLLEHGLKADGRPDPEATDIGEPGSFETFFTETGNGKYVPRSIFVDLDPSVRTLLLRCIYIYVCVCVWICLHG